LTRHHIKDSDGRRTSKIIILCRPCHDLAEERYEREGKLNESPPAYLIWLISGGDKKITSKDNVTDDSLIPFHARHHG